MGQSEQGVFESNGWEIDLAARELRIREMTVPLGSRALEIIEVLAQSAGDLVTKDELVRRVWPGAIVEDNTIQVHISAIRRALGADRGRLKTVSGRGYRLLGAWTIRRDPGSPMAGAIERDSREPSSFQTNVPVAAAALVGRETAVQQLRDLVSAYRAVTLTGPGGIGKTVLASEVARRLFPTIKSDIFFIELASLADPNLAPSAVASVLGLQLSGDEISSASVARAIGGRKILLVLDNCEHVIDAAAALAETLLRVCPNVTVLATSREVLRIEGESVYQVAPLDVPLQHQETSDDLLGHSAVQLFVTRLRSLQAGFPAHGENLRIVAAICRRLDGIPLAIEFAAARAATLGLRQVAEHLDDRLALLTDGRRTALPRHQTLRATLDWSYELLPETERRLLQHLAIFPAGFTLDAVAAIADDQEPSVAIGISSLVSKSMVAIDRSEVARGWRLLETTRVYALEKLASSGERDRAMRRLVEYYRDLFARAQAEALARPRADWLSAYAWQIDNLRAALDWAFATDDGDVSTGAALTAAAVPLWVYLSLTEECRRRVERALAASSAAGGADAQLEMKLQGALGASLGYIGDAVIQTEAAWTRTLELALSLGNIDYQLRALWGLAVISERETLEIAQRFAAVASTPADRLIGDQMIGQAYHFRGNQSDARRHLERVVANKDIAADRVFRFHLDQQPACTLARVLWLQGLSEQAMVMAVRVVEQAEADDHVNSLCHALVYAACPIALWVGHLDLAEQYINLLHEASSRLPPTNWHPVGRAYHGVLLIKRGDLRTGLPRLRAAFEECRAVPAGFRLKFIAELAEALCPGEVSGGLATIEEAIERAERDGDGWVLAELLRVKGELLRLDGRPENANAAEDCFLRALHLAGAQGALFWELRAAISLATLHRVRGRSTEAAGCLRPIYDRFTEGFDTADLIMAKKLLDELSDAIAHDPHDKHQHGHRESSPLKS